MYEFEVRPIAGSGMSDRSVWADYIDVNFGVLLFYKRVGTGIPLLILTIGTGLWKSCEIISQHPSP